MIKRLLLSLICIWSLTALSAQTVYPIRSYTILTPPMPYSLSSFAGETGKMQLNINVDDISLDNYPVKFRLFITGNGIRLYTKPNMIQDPYYLFGGMTETLTGLDLAPLFDPNNLIFEGFSKRQYEVEGRLPEGVYQVKVEVWDYHHNINISQAIPGVAVMYLTRAPQLTLPFDNSELDILNNLNIRFSWMGFVPNDPLSDIVYEFKLWEILPDGRSKYEVANSVAPIFTQQTSEAYLVYDMGMPPLQTGRSYAWQVQAVDLDNRARFQNDGYSDVFQFRYGASCPNATISIKEIGNTQATFNISMSKGAQLYRIFYKTEDTEEWQSTETDNRSYTLTNLDENTTYQVKVVCLCGNDESDESSVTTFKTKWDIDYTCGTNLAGVDLSNTEPLAELKRFGLFKAADFTIEVVEVSGSDGRFSGSGFALVPYLGFIKFGVDFDNVFINSDRRMTEGEVKFQFNKDTGLMLDLGSVMAALTPDNDNTITVDPSEAVDQSTDYVIKVDDEISSVVVTDSTVTVVTVGGESKTYTANPGQTVGVVSPDGKTVYVADTSTGQVYTAPNPNTANTNANSVVSPAQSGEYGVTATFSPASNMRYGYDAVGNGTNKPNTYFNTDKQGNKIAWKSLGNGRADYVDVSINGADPDSIRFLRSSGMLASTIDQGGKKQLLLTGMAGGQEETLTAAFVKTTKVNDSTQNETLTEAGALGLVNYDYLLKTVHLIPVNGAKCPNNAGAVRDLLNQYYGSAVVEWEVRVEKGFETDKINSDGFNTEDKTLLSKYTSDMNTIISRYKKQDGVSINKDHLYLFFVECTTNKQGFMPLTGRYGFIFNFGSNAETIAHELGHGAFNLWHTFSDKGQYKLTEGSTPNLMDYSGGTELWKYQWDLIHDPQNILFAWGVDEDESQAISSDYNAIIKSRRICHSETLDNLLLKDRNRFAFRSPDNLFNDENHNLFSFAFSDASSIDIKMFEHDDRVYPPYRGSVAIINIGDIEYNARFKGTVTDFEFKGFFSTENGVSEIFELDKVVEYTSEVQLPFVKQGEDGKYYYRIANLSDLGSDDTEDKYKELSDCQCFEQTGSSVEANGVSGFAVTPEELQAINDILKASPQDLNPISNVYYVTSKAEAEVIQLKLSGTAEAIAIDKTNNKTYLITTASIYEVDGNPDSFAVFMNLAKAQAIAGFKILIELNTLLLENATIPQKYWNLENPEYSAKYYKAFAILGYSEEEFAFFCGVYDGVLEVVGDVAGVLNLFIATENPGELKEMLSGVFNLKAIKDVIVDAHTGKNKYELQHQIGTDVVYVATFVYAAKDLPKAAADITNAINKNIKYATKKAAKVFNSFTDAVKATLKKTPDGFIVEVLEDQTILFKKGDNIIATRTPEGNLYSGEIDETVTNSNALNDFGVEDDGFWDILDEYGDSGDILELEDWIRISKWDYPPSKDCYIKYKTVYDKPKYFNQKTGEVIYPKDDGFKDISKAIDKKLNKGDIIDRYGSEDGDFLSPESTPWEERSIPPFTDKSVNTDYPYTKYEVLKEFEVKAGEIASWFDQPGGGQQYYIKGKKIQNLDGDWVDCTIKNLKSNGYIEIVE
nr:glycohydrolase toxin TNT-related protein [uncultured Carboxylicivirga sp.]